MLTTLGQALSYLRARLNFKDAEGQTIVEYTLMIVLVGLAVALAAPNITSAIINVFNQTSSVLATPSAS